MSMCAPVNAGAGQIAQNKREQVGFLPFESNEVFGAGRPVLVVVCSEEARAAGHGCGGCSGAHCNVTFAAACGRRQRPLALVDGRSCGC